MRDSIALFFSPCPNDTFVFDAMVHQRIDTEGMNFIFEMHDVETLNQMALRGEADVIKSSYFTYLMVQQRYALLDSGSAMGFGNGPLIIAREPHSVEDLRNLTIAVPGEYTTAHLLLSLLVPATGKKEFMVFSSIEEAVLTGKVDAGVIIHENRFTYEQKGLVRIMDLGARWEELTSSPVPLGGILARKGLGYDTINALNRVLYRSVSHAMSHPLDAMPFVRSNAREMDEEVMKNHIGLYVNQNTLSLGTGGRVAIAKMQRMALEKGLIGNL